MRFVGSIVTIVGSALFLVGLNQKLGTAALLPAVAIGLITWALTPWIRSENSTNLVSVGKVSAEVSESLENFKVVAVFERRDYFRKNFERVNAKNYDHSIRGLGPSVFALFSVRSVDSFGLRFDPHGSR